MPTLIAAANAQHATGDSQNVSVSFNIKEHNQSTVMHTIRPLVPGDQPPATPCSAVLDTAIFVAQ
jgi:hypothetical protein